MEYLTVAHALLWHLYGPQRLGEEARQAFADADAGQACIHVPAVVLAEALMVVQKGRLRGVTLAHLLPYLDVMATSDNCPLCPLRPHTVIASHHYTIIPDIFDRLIVTEAISHGLPLLTRDTMIRASGLVAVIWD